MAELDWCKQIFVTDDEIDLLKTLLAPGTDFTDDGDVNEEATEDVQKQTKLFNRLYKQRRGDAEAIWVSVYDMQQCYGGPEEGGWWYWANYLTSSRASTEVKDIVNFWNESCAAGLTDASLTIDADRLHRAIQDMQDGQLVVLEAPIIRDRGEERWVVIELQLGCKMTTERPIYC